jgi:hypothetical protein
MVGKIRGSRPPGQEVGGLAQLLGLGERAGG